MSSVHPVSEFDLIAQYFSVSAPPGLLGVGDDCALLRPDSGMQIALSTDLLLEGRHFLPDTDPRRLGHKALAVNLSDLAAMGARPLACLLGVSLPVVDHPWLAAFSAGFHALAARAGCPLVGGDTTASPGGIVLSVTVVGQVPEGRALLRSTAQADDDIFVTGLLGGPDVALKLLRGEIGPDEGLLAATRSSLEEPLPPWEFAAGLPGLAHAALDISDGLLQDLGHILEASACGADLAFEDLPADPAITDLPENLRVPAILAGGDVYQLCFTAPPSSRSAILDLADRRGVRVSRVGRTTREPGLRVFAADGRIMQPLRKGFDHFS